MGETGSAVAVEDPRFAAFFPPDAKLERIAEGFIWAEGPVWFDEIGELRFSDIPNNRMMAWTQEGGLRVFRQPAQSTNGHTRDRDGAMISCEHTGRCVSRTRMDGTYEVLATHWQGKRLNSPNDVVVKSDGSIWFTDPPYGIISDHEGIRAESEIGSNNVYRIDPDTGAVDLVADDFDRPNGGGAQATPGLDNDAVRVLDQAEQLAERAGDSFVPVQRLLQALALSDTVAPKVLFLKQSKTVLQNK